MNYWLMVKVHGKGGHGRYSREANKKFEHKEKTQEKRERAVLKAQRKFSVQAEKAITSIINQSKKDVVPIADNARKRIDIVAKKGGISREGYILRILAIDKFVADNIKKMFEKDAITKEYLKDINFDNYHWLSPNDRTNLLSQIIGNNVRVKKQKRILEQIDSFSKKVKDFAVGRI
jgi:hypothetical protein